MNVTLPVPEYKKVKNQIIKVKFLDFKEFYKVMEAGSEIIKVREYKPSKYFAIDKPTGDIIFVLGAFSYGRGFSLKLELYD